MGKDKSKVGVSLQNTGNKELQGISTLIKLVDTQNKRDQEVTGKLYKLQQQRYQLAPSNPEQYEQQTDQQSPQTTPREQKPDKKEQDLQKQIDELEKRKGQLAKDYDNTRNQLYGIFASDTASKSTYTTYLRTGTSLLTRDKSKENEINGHIVIAVQNNMPWLVKAIYEVMPAAQVGIQQLVAQILVTTPGLDMKPFIDAGVTTSELIKGYIYSLGSPEFLSGLMKNDFRIPGMEGYFNPHENDIKTLIQRGDIQSLEALHTHFTTRGPELISQGQVLINEAEYQKGNEYWYGNRGYIDEAYRTNNEQKIANWYLKAHQGDINKRYADALYPGRVTMPQNNSPEAQEIANQKNQTTYNNLLQNAIKNQQSVNDKYFQQYPNAVNEWFDNNLQSESWQGEIYNWHIGQQDLKIVEGNRLTSNGQSYLGYLGGMQTLQAPKQPAFDKLTGLKLTEAQQAYDKQMQAYHFAQAFYGSANTLAGSISNAIIADHAAASGSSLAASLILNDSKYWQRIPQFNPENPGVEIGSTLNQPSLATHIKLVSNYLNEPTLSPEQVTSQLQQLQGRMAEERQMIPDAIKNDALHLMRIVGAKLFDDNPDVRKNAQAMMTMLSTRSGELDKKQILEDNKPGTVGKFALKRTIRKEGGDIYREAEGFLKGLEEKNRDLKTFLQDLRKETSALKDDFHQAYIKGQLGGKDAEGHEIKPSYEDTKTRVESYIRGAILKSYDGDSVMTKKLIESKSGVFNETVEAFTKNLLEEYDKPRDKAFLGMGPERGILHLIGKIIDAIRDFLSDAPNVNKDKVLLLSLDKLSHEGTELKWTQKVDQIRAKEVALAQNIGIEK